MGARHGEKSGIRRDVVHCAISIWTPLKDGRIAARWFSFPDSFVFPPVPALIVLLVWMLWKRVGRPRDPVSFVCSIGLFFLAFAGLVISL
jgi:cytochrome d ubiquinol oxidase subunit II